MLDVSFTFVDRATDLLNLLNLITNFGDRRSLAQKCVNFWHQGLVWLPQLRCEQRVHLVCYVFGIGLCQCLVVFFCDLYSCSFFVFTVAWWLRLLRDLLSGNFLCGYRFLFLVYFRQINFFWKAAFNTRRNLFFLYYNFFLLFDSWSYFRRLLKFGWIIS